MQDEPNLPVAPNMYPGRRKENIERTLTLENRSDWVTISSRQGYLHNADHHVDTEQEDPCNQRPRKLARESGRPSGAPVPVDDHG